MTTMKSSPELSLDMNLDSPSAAGDVADGSGNGGGMDCDEKNTTSSTVGVTIQHTHNQRHHGDNSSYNGHQNVANIAGNTDYSSFSGGGSIGIDVNRSSNNANHGEGGAFKIDCDKMTQLIEGWKDELSMMRVKNAILLDDLVKVGASV